jgi:hypothetical protein
MESTSSPSRGQCVPSSYSSEMLLTIGDFSVSCCIKSTGPSELGMVKLMFSNFGERKIKMSRQDVRSGGAIVRSVNEMKGCGMRY